MGEKEVCCLLEKDHITCELCSKEISLIINRKDQLIGFKNHLKQAHLISIVDYFGLINESKCKFCKTNQAFINIIKTKEGVVKVKRFDLCSDLVCTSNRKRLNSNSVEYVAITENVSLEEAKVILQQRNTSPFYKSNFKNEEEYRTSQRRFSPRCPEYYVGKINPKTQDLYTEKEIELSITALQAKFGKQNQNENSRKWSKVFKSNLKGFIEKYGEDGKQRYLEYKKKTISGKKKSTNYKLIPYTLRWYQFIYGIKEGKIAFKHRIQYCKYIHSELYYKIVFDKEWKDKYTDSLNEHTYYKAVSSKVANKFFAELIERIDFEDRKYIWTSFTKKERFIQNEDKKYFYDFTLKSSDRKKIIEFNGDFWHANPKKYSEEDFITFYKKTYRVKEIWEKDADKIHTARANGYEVLIVWESDIISAQNRDLQLSRCLQFLRG